MKRMIPAAIVAACFTLTSCGFGSASKTASTTQAQVEQTVTNGANTLTNLLSSIVGNTTTQSMLTGTWTYSGPKVVFESDNVLSKLGGQVAAYQIESKFGAQLEKYGFKAGSTSVTFSGENSCSIAIGSKTYQSIYSFDADSKKLTLTDALGVKLLTCTVSVAGSNLNILFDADKLLTLLNTMNSGSNSSSTLSALLKNYNGLQLGLTMTK